MLQYAAGDVCYLIPLALALEKELRKKRRFTWVMEESKHLSRVKYDVNHHDPLFIKFKGAGKLSRRNLAVLEGLLQYRKKIARQKDRPLFKVFSNISLMKLATTTPLSMRKLQKTNTLSRRQIDIHGKGLIAEIKKCVDLPQNKLPRYPRKKSPVLSPKVHKTIKALKDWRDDKAGEYGIDPALILNKSFLCAIAATKPKCVKDLDQIEGLKNWQKKAFGREVVNELKKLNLNGRKNIISKR
jgi:ribonuclease D